MNKRLHIYGIAAETHTGILLFSRSPEAEAKACQLGLSEQRATRLYRTLRTKIEDALLSLDLPLIVVEEVDQQGTGFAERLTNAVTSTFALGFQSLVVVGGDSLDYSAQDVAQAAEALRDGDEVIGRDQRGGVYLLGLHASRFRKNLFESLPWQTPLLADALASLLTSCRELHRRHDLNEAKDLLQVLPRLKGRKLWSFLFEPTEAPVVLAPAAVLSSDCVIAQVDGRGPPVEV